MMKFTRYLATRLRRLASPAPATFAFAPAPHETGEARRGWERLDAFIMAPVATGCGLLERELVQENARAAITLVGQDGARLVRRVAELHESGAAHASEPALLVLVLAHAHGNTHTREEALRALARVARAGSALTPRRLSPAGGRDRTKGATACGHGRRPT